MVLGFHTLLLATAAAFSTATAAKEDNLGFGPVGPHPVAAANETGGGLVVSSAGPLARATFRVPVTPLSTGLLLCPLPL